MKKFTILLFVLFILINCVSTSLAATKEDVISALHSSYYVSEKQPNFRLSSKYIQKGEQYLNEHPLKPEQYDMILAAINKGVAFAREVGHTRYKEYTKEQYNTALNIILEACAAANVDLEEEINKEEAVKVKEEPKVKVSSAKTIDDKPVVIETNKETNEITVTISGEVISDVTIDEDNNIKNSSGEVIVFSGDVKPVETKAPVPSTVSSVKMSKVNSIIVAIFAIEVVIIIINFLLIRLIFKKKWNKIIKVILGMILIVGTLAVLVGLCMSIYYIDIIKKMLQLYYLFK